MEVEENPREPHFISEDPKKHETWKQFKLLIWKNWLIFRRNPRSSMFQIITPVFICLYMLLLQNVLNIGQDTDMLSPPTENINEITKCWNKDCNTIGIAVTTQQTEWSRYVINYVAENYDMEIGKDLVVFEETQPPEFLDYLSDNMNKTLMGVVLCTNYMEIGIDKNLTNNLKDRFDEENEDDESIYSQYVHYLHERDDRQRIPCSAGKLFDVDLYVYALLLNNTLVPPVFLSSPGSAAPVDRPILALKNAIDNGILNYKRMKAGEPPMTMEVQTEEYPHISNRFFKGYDVVATSGAFYFFIPPMVTFVVLLIEVTREKELKLRLGLSVMGMNATSYWASWISTGFMFSVGVSLLTCVFGYICWFDLFWGTPFIIMFTLFLMFTFAMAMLAFFLSTLVSTQKLAYTLSYVFLLGGLVLQFVFQDSMIMSFFHLYNVDIYLLITRILLCFYPPFNFARIFTFIAAKSGKHMNWHLGMWQAGAGFGWSDLIHDRRGHRSGFSYYVPSPLLLFGYLLIDILIYAASIWYYDNVIFKKKPFYFFLKPCLCCKRRRRLTRYTAQSDEIEMSDLGENGNSAHEEHVKVEQLERDGAPVEGLRIMGVHKTFHKVPFGCISCAGDIHAVNNVNLEIEKDELVALLGHNGAGKTTLISCMLGIHSFDAGTININGIDISEDLDAIRKIVGYCPQHNILWDELTAKEHIQVFMRLKGIYDDNIIENKLKEVSLDDVADVLVGTFSGGMKRRLSVAVSGLGDPAVIFLDEPTTGMDPQCRRQVWELIQKLKRNRVVILTSHSMEEADLLSDRLVVMVDGKFKCIGTSLYLKNNFGDGYRINIITKEPKVVFDFIKKVIPSVNLIDQSAGSLILSISQEELAEIVKLFKILESPVECTEGFNLNELIEDWGLSQTTLEEVFCRVTAKKDSNMPPSDQENNQVSINSNSKNEKEFNIVQRRKCREGTKEPEATRSRRITSNTQFNSMKGAKGKAQVYVIDDAINRSMEKTKHMIS